MVLPVRFALVVLLAGLVGGSALARQPRVAKEPPKSEAELKALEEKLHLLMRELREQHAKKAAEPKPAPAPPAKPQEGGATMIVPVQIEADPAHAHLRGLTKHSDPKVAALAKELLERLAKPAAPKGQLSVPGFGLLNDIEFQIELTPNHKKTFELLFAPDGKGEGIPFEFKSAQIQIVNDEPAKAGPAKAASSLRMSTDGKAAAVTTADGTVVVYDVASGRELMRFPGKK
jgi:hypothetical protein